MLVSDDDDGALDNDDRYLCLMDLCHNEFFAQLKHVLTFLTYFLTAKFS